MMPDHNRKKGESQAFCEGLVKLFRDWQQGVVFINFQKNKVRAAGSHLRQLWKVS
jgi:hypothetical protein